MTTHTLFVTNRLMEMHQEANQAIALVSMAEDVLDEEHALREWRAVVEDRLALRGVR